eukprot:TRINITY_DN6816_c0_g1_i2.p1 TRINITY_DN6816_c0_g1~~TRINITY_DN6816_c0_g1_i2.p1  ORF type:complete len:910 (+),score=185.31 TRINITY_DN6816_c0_g1_i2:236-2731(+)
MEKLILVLKNSLDDPSQWESQVHSLNVLRAVFRDSKLAVSTLAFVSDSTLMILRGFSHSEWAVRNSSLMCFTAIIQLALRSNQANLLQGKSGNEKGLTFSGFFSQYPALKNYVTDVLSLVRTEQEKDRAIEPPTLQPVLLLLSRLMPSQGYHELSSSLDDDEEDTKNAVETDETHLFANSIISLTDSQLGYQFHTRSMASRALIPLVSSTHETMCKLVQSLPDMGSQVSHNSIQGTLLHLQGLIRQLPRLPDELARYLQIQFVGKSWLCCFGKSPYLRLEFLRTLSALSLQLRQKGSGVFIEFDQFISQADMGSQVSHNSIQGTLLHLQGLIRQLPRLPDELARYLQIQFVGKSWLCCFGKSPYLRLEFLRTLSALSLQLRQKGSGVFIEFDQFISQVSLKIALDSYPPEFHHLPGGLELQAEATQIFVVSLCSELRSSSDFLLIENWHNFANHQLQEVRLAFSKAISEILSTECHMKTHLLEIVGSNPQLRADLFNSLHSTWHGYCGAVLRAVASIPGDANTSLAPLSKFESLGSLFSANVESQSEWLSLCAAEIRIRIDSQLDGEQKIFIDKFLSSCELIIFNGESLDKQRLSAIEAINRTNLLKMLNDSSLCQHSWRAWKLMIEALVDQQSENREASAVYVSSVLGLKSTPLASRALEDVLDYFLSAVAETVLLSVVIPSICTMVEDLMEFSEHSDLNEYTYKSAEDYERDLFEKEKANEFKEPVLLLQLYLGFLWKASDRFPLIVLKHLDVARTTSQVKRVEKFHNEKSGSSFETCPPDVFTISYGVLLKSMVLNQSGATIPFHPPEMLQQQLKIERHGEIFLFLHE